MLRVTIKRMAMAAAAAGLATLAACAPPPPPPPPPPVVQIPPRPTPPMAAAPNMTIPPAGLDGSRITVNSNLDSQQAVWNLRSAYNVAALNCQKPEHAAILANYGAFLKTHEKALAAVNKALDKKYKTDFGASFIKEREGYTTQVYNYFALPPVLPVFCDKAVDISQQLLLVPAGQLEANAPPILAQFEKLYQDFYASYDQWRADVAAWDARYGPRYSTPAVSTPTYGQPGLVTLPDPSVPSTAPSTAQPVVQPTLSLPGESGTGR